MPTPDSFRSRVLRGEPLVGTFLNLGSAMAAELCSRAGFDWLVVDLEHGVLTESGLLPTLQALDGTPAVPVVRVEEGTRLRIGRALDMGAPALMVPRVEDAAHAAHIVTYVRYPPLGTRGVALPTRGAGYGALTHERVGRAHEDICLFIQIEGVSALQSADQIAGLDGVDVLFVGPTDLSHSLGVPGNIAAAEYLDAAAAVAGAARRHGKAAGVLLWTLDDLAQYREMGYTVFAVGSDGGYVVAAARTLAAAFGERMAADQTAGHT